MTHVTLSAKTNHLGLITIIQYDTNKPLKKLPVDFGIIADIKYTIPTAPSGVVANARPLPFVRQRRLVVDRD